MSEHNGADRHDALESAQQQGRDDPIFEVIIPSTIAVGTPLFHFKVWGDGYIEGFERLNGGTPIVHNRFPLMIDMLLQPIKDWVQDVDQQLDQLAPKEPS